ncbi:HAMP domain-containing protein [Nordella sp. HKS 07]|uniref:adenylate/guanylate cyclase domain-containing protein n=1 Tax=Nordella sp. HKS 07 TaxID=2712222 RepID=UPI0013E2017F|nr:adenylate/guanylate cyclase domain-containing protein [Nordella sp. HKS 07]QIG50369.1 HAMP domain-containing protein [Nordella sp. HKS 07]
MNIAAAAPQIRRRRPRLGLSIKLYVAIAGAVALILAASVVAWISFVELGQLQRRITREHIPSMTDSLRLAQRSALIAATAPALVSAASEAEREALMQAVRDHQRMIGALIDDLERQSANATDPGNPKQHITGIRQATGELATALDRLDGSVGRQLLLKAELAERRDRAVELHRRLIGRLTPLLDDATMYLVTGYRTLEDPAPVLAGERLSQEALLDYTAIAQLGIEGNLIGGFLAEAANIPDVTLLPPLRERYEAAADRFRTALAVVRGNEAEVLRVIADGLINLGEGASGIFVPRHALLVETQAAEALAGEARTIAARLTGDVDRLVAGVRARTDEAVAASNRAIDVGSKLLFVLNAISIMGALLIGWWYVARQVTAPVVRITDAAASFEERRFDPESLSHVRTRTDELGDLARTFTRMAGEVQTRTDTLDRLVAERTSELENVANRLAKYLSPQIYSSIFSAKGAATGTLARKNLTIFFSDIAGFTDISDGMEPERLSFFINTYLSEMSNIAIEHGGTIDKFIGDAMLVFFGDPETEGDRNDALRCARMALRMRERVIELDKTWHENGISKPLRTRMGITTGYCTVGNFGSEHRLDYTVLGGTVNLAARLETRAEPGTILMADSTWLLIQDVADATPMGEITPKGFARPVGCYRLNGLVAPDTADAVQLAGRHVTVSVAHKRHIQEAIEEMRRMEEDLARRLPAD